MGFLRDVSRKISRAGKDEEFLGFIKIIETLVSKLLSLAMIVVILIAVIDLGIILGKELIFDRSIGRFNDFLVDLFGLFLNILIALEILENITAYLRKHVIQVELVIVTSLIAVARKIIILDLEKIDGTEIIGLGIAIIALSISYWIVRHINSKSHHE
ncbi:phosphate-starvation-inducible PsiE family protein [Argonema galeatum]|uniref:phosphate-starvation-inducible PsiE family protein n=1 Tax=Argonema galeatum TaxID=2942762 RepID=UPI0020126D13|nr:phosphate-starvation-inducible PsiE family protein [Argonema galeatum]MCL1467050.1 phosphate-starvation-inducible PsiE family protein [Argonema galeatum A003/A1]